MKGEATRMAQHRVERRLAAILAGDVAGYSRLMGADEEGTLARLNAHRRELLEPTIAEHINKIAVGRGARRPPIAREDVKPTSEYDTTI